MVHFLPSRRVALEVLGLEVYWYGLLYIVAFVLGWRLAPRLAKFRDLQLTSDTWLTIVTSCMAGTLVGGRLGYALFYEPHLFFEPQRLSFLGQGGMASHGGFIGVALALWLTSRAFQINFLALTDVIVVPVALGLALGRLGNFINQELYVSTVAHMLAIAKDLCIAALTYASLRYVRQPGTTSALFLISYGVLRFATEYLRLPDFPLMAGFSRGQWLTLPVFAAGVLLFIWTRLYKKRSR